ncbi:MAG: NAD(P)-dependent oxidoreductase [Candidatus Omnitrophica bacterium]|nr:NAD(P)-dependent oxidoreductase [Candidatus Omnitrophota bacterium]
MKKVLITGGAGFIAKNLKEQFSDDFLIDAPKRRELDLLDAEAVSSYVKKGKFDIVIHAATYDAAPKDSPKDPSKVLENNLKMFFNIIRCKDHFGKMIFFGSGAEYNRHKWIPQMSENYFDRYVPDDQYGFSKYIMTKYALACDNIINLRLFAVFGKYEDWRYRTISNYCCKALLNLPIIIPQNKRFDFLYVDDLVKIVKWFINNNCHRKVYNVCSGQVFDFKTIAERVLEISGKNLGIIVEQESSLEYSGDNSLLLDEIGDFQFTPLDIAIRSLYEWYQSCSRSLIDKNQFHY